MNVNNQINTIQKQILGRLNIRAGSTLYKILSEISQQACAKNTFTVSQKGETLAKKIGVTGSSISRNLKKIKNECSDLLTITQNKNNGKFGSTTFTFLALDKHALMSDGERAIAQCLNEMNIDYLIQYPAVIGTSTRYFDLYCPFLKLFIEVHGIQHFEDSEHFNTKANKMKAIDQQKQNYAEKIGHYIMVDYREHNPQLAVERFTEQFKSFLKTQRVV